MTLLQRVLHKCALCNELLLLDSDTIAMHLKSKHKGVSHKEYNARHMVNMGGRMAGREESVQRAELEEEVNPEADSEEKLSQEIEQLEKQLLRDNTDKAKLCEREMREVSMMLVKNEVSVSKVESLSTVEKMDNFMTRLRPVPMATPPGVDVSGEFTVNEVVEDGREEEEESTLEEGSKNSAEKEDDQLKNDEISTNQNVVAISCLECGLKLASKADLLKHLQSEHYQQYLLALAKQFFPDVGSESCARCGENFKASVAIQLIHIGEKHPQFPRQTI